MDVKAFYTSITAEMAINDVMVGDLVPEPMPRTT